jgi:hypothetical protein
MEEEYILILHQFTLIHKIALSLPTE